jgi:hypothetical protein
MLLQICMVLSQPLNEVNQSIAHSINKATKSKSSQNRNPLTCRLAVEFISATADCLTDERDTTGAGAEAACVHMRVRRVFIFYVSVSGQSAAMRTERHAMRKSKECMGWSVETETKTTRRKTGRKTRTVQELAINSLTLKLRLRSAQTRGCNGLCQ